MQQQEEREKHRPLTFPCFFVAAQEDFSQKALSSNYAILSWTRREAPYAILSTAF